MAKGVLPKLASKANSSVLEAVSAEKGLTLFISNEDEHRSNKCAELLQKLGLLIDGATETVTFEIQKPEGGFHGAMMASITASTTAPMAFSLKNAMTEK